MLSPHVSRAPHLVGDQAGTVERQLAEHVLRPGAPILIGQVSNGIHDLQIDTFDARLRSLPPGIDDVGDIRARCARISRLLSLYFCELDDRLARARTGSLIRVLVQTDTADAFCLSVVAAQHLVGLSLGLAPGRPRTDTGAADHVMADLVDRRRAYIGLQTLNHGGFRGQRTGRPFRPSAIRAGEGSGGLVGQLAAHARSMADELDQDALHWLALRKGGQQVTIVDQFDDPDVRARFFGLTSPDVRRHCYADLTADIHATVGKFARMVRPVMGGPIRNLILDVESGAVAIRPLNPTTFLIGVTLFQPCVPDLEAAMATLAGRPDHD